MQWLIERLTWLLHAIRNPGEFIIWGGYPALTAIIYAETGAMVFFLPGDSLLVVAGLYAATGQLSLPLLLLLLLPAAIAGNFTSYEIGKRVGPALFRKPKSRFFNPAHIQSAHAFYEKHGGKAIIIARFMPIVRTFVPIVAGIAKMERRPFIIYSVIGAVAWVTSMLFIGFFLGQLVPNIGQHIEKVIVVVVFLSLVPGIVEWLRSRGRRKAAAAAAPAAVSPASADDAPRNS